MSLAGLRVLSLESRRAREMEILIRNQGGEAFVAPSMGEVPLAENEEAFAFAGRLFAGEFDMVIFLTGVGARYLRDAIATQFPAERFAEALRGVTTVARGPKPVAALREMGVPVTISIPEPNTYREVLAALAGRPERRIAVQEYGRSNPELLAGLRARGAEVTPVRVYRWSLPEDTGPLERAVELLASAACDLVLFTTSVQVEHLFAVARATGQEEAVRRTLAGRAVVASIGPTTTAALAEERLTPDLEPSHPKMGILVKEASEQAAALLDRKRSGVP